jgi:hypothetical protein
MGVIFECEYLFGGPDNFIMIFFYLSQRINPDLIYKVIASGLISNYHHLEKHIPINIKLRRAYVFTANIREFFQ